MQARAHHGAHIGTNHQQHHQHQHQRSWPSIIATRRSSRRARVAPVAASANAADASMMAVPAIVVFSAPGCPYCKRAKQDLADRSLAFAEVDVSSDDGLRRALAAATGRSTVPQVFANGGHVGGSDDLQASLASGAFEVLLSGAVRPLPEELRGAVERAAAAAATAATDRQLPAELRAVADALADPATGIVASASSSGDADCAATKAFSGAALLSWLEGRAGGSGGSGGGGGGGSAASSAAATGAALLEANVVTVVSDSQPTVQEASAVAPGRRYRLRADAPLAVRWGQPLNASYWWGPRPARPAAVVSEDLRAAALALYDAHSDSGGRGGVDYAAARADARLWSRYADAAAELQRADLSALSSKEELSAFAINAYNALIVHALVAHGGSRLASAATRGSFFKEGAKYLVGGLEYSADDLEHGVLRGNRPPPSSLPALLLGLVGLRARAPGPFADGDPRGRAVVAGPIDARLHFALVCGARACPPIRVYRASNLDEGLRAAAEAFCAGDVEVDAAQRRVTQSKIFQWYAPDFGDTKASRLRFLLPFLPPDKRDALQGMLDADPSAASITVQHREYDWRLNGADE